MKKRVRTDTVLLAVTIGFTAFLYMFPGVYLRNQYIDNWLDFFGMIVLLKGIILRMTARGHKLRYSAKSKKLVTSGPYCLVRNPMYLGSFLMGAGFILMVWPLWVVPIFAVLFYLRFKRQVIKEEIFLTEMFGKEYEEYCVRTPRIFPRIRNIFKVRIKDIFNIDEAFSTKEKRGLFVWPVFAVVLETLQELVVYRQVDIITTIVIFCSAMVIFFIGLMIMLQISK